MLPSLNAARSAGLATRSTAVRLMSACSSRSVTDSSTGTSVIRVKTRTPPRATARFPTCSSSCTSCSFRVAPVPRPVSVLAAAPVQPSFRHSPERSSMSIAPAAFRICSALAIWASLVVRTVRPYEPRLKASV